MEESILDLSARGTSQTNIWITVGYRSSQLPVTDNWELQSNTVEILCCLNMQVEHAILAKPIQTILFITTKIFIINN